MISIERFEKEVEDIVEQLMKLYRPKKIIQFGSLINGNINEGTDIDLLVIKEDVPHIGVDRIRNLTTQLENFFSQRIGSQRIKKKIPIYRISETLN